MKVLVIYKGGFPSGLAMTKRLQLYVKGLKEVGNDIKIIIPHASDKAGMIRNKEIKGEFENIQYEYLSKTTERSNTFFLRRLNDLVGYLKLLKYLFLEYSTFDIVFLVDVRNTWRIPIYLLCKIRKIKVVYELNEHPLVFSSDFKYWFEKKIIFKMFDGYIVISENLKHLVEGFKKNKCKILKVPILTNSVNIDDNNFCPNKLSRDYIIHAGGLSDSKEGIIDLIKALHFVNNNSPIKIDLFFTGNLNDSPDEIKIKSTIEILSLQNNIKFLGYLSDFEVLDYQKNALLALINKPNNLQNNFCFPTKLGEYMVLAKPVIVSKVGEYMNYLKNNYNAIVLEENTPECLGESIIKVLMDKEYYKQIGINGKVTADVNFNYMVQAKSINTFFNSL
ncbi:MAG: glycosyltransferase [Bacteroidota bacterium]